MGPRFLMTMIPFLALPIGIALKRYPGPTIALAGVSLTTTILATITHPLIGYENETVTWMRYVRQGLFQPTIASAYGLGRGWGGIWPFLLAAGGAIVLATLATVRTRISRASLSAGVIALAGWCLFALLGPTLLGIDHQGLLEIVKAGDNTALNLTLHNGSRYPLRALAPVAAGAGLFALICARIVAGGPVKRRRPRTHASTSSLLITPGRVPDQRNPLQPEVIHGSRNSFDTPPPTPGRQLFGIFLSFSRL